MATEPFSKSPKQPLSPSLELAQIRARLNELEAQEEIYLKHQTADVGALIDIPVELLSPNPWPSRLVIEADAVSRLAESITQFRLLQPILVRRHPEVPGSYQIVAGELRWRAVQELGWQTISAVLIEVADNKMSFLSLCENMGRESYSDSELNDAMTNLRNAVKE